jgi:hypothetical protein
MRNCFNHTKMSGAFALISMDRSSSLLSVFEISGKESIKKDGMERDFIFIKPRYIPI